MRKKLSSPRSAVPVTNLMEAGYDEVAANMTTFHKMSGKVAENVIRLESKVDQLVRGQKTLRLEVKGTGLDLKSIKKALANAGYALLDLNEDNYENDEELRLENEDNTDNTQLDSTSAPHQVYSFENPPPQKDLEAYEMPDGTCSIDTVIREYYSIPVFNISVPELLELAPKWKKSHDKVFRRRRRLVQQFEALPYDLTNDEKIDAVNDFIDSCEKKMTVAKIQRILEGETLFRDFDKKPLLRDLLGDERLKKFKQ
eukprot:Nk52_evm1s444 gene=Nk52_evmTU1s444